MTTNKKKSGIYRIKNLETGAMYIGRTAESFAKRWGKHRRTLRAGYHDNEHLQRSYDKHGPSAFEYKVLEIISQGDMSDKEFINYINEREIILIAEHDTRQNGYNQTDGGGGVLGYEATAEARAKISRAKKGKKYGPMSEAHKAKLSAAHKGRKFSAETRAKISKRLKGNKYGQGNKGKKYGPLSNKHKAKLSAIRKGKPWSAARRAAQEALKEAF